MLKLKLFLESFLNGLILALVVVGISAMFLFKRYELAKLLDNL